ncbi:MAG: hypothetical protein GWP91_18480, partial [Rhodobacterales bacterium]|nr:hypothetical protein [Rhodobacterales bacterium]
MRPGLRTLLLALTLAGPSCGKVPIYGVNAAFLLADAAWFAEEETLFVFYDVEAEQGLGEPSVIEITYTTDDARVDWTPINEFEPVHTHLDVNCGAHSLCGSMSIHVPIQPRNVDIRLRYHRDGQLALGADAIYNVKGLGRPHSKRSLVVYGVFDERNEWVQWRARHEVPTVVNELAERYGLRRAFVVNEQRHGTSEIDSGTGEYGYGSECPDVFPDMGIPQVATLERAVFNDEILPLDASDSSLVCAQATVTDAKGTFTTGAIAQKNPEVREAFPVLRSPVHQATPIQFFLAPCTRVISAEHEAMQRQRLFMQNEPTYCIDDWNSAGFVNGLVVAFRDAVEAERVNGRDMVLVVAVNQDETGVSEAVEEALLQVVPDERHRSSPRLAGAFVLDSDSRGLENDELAPSTLWCPSTIPLDELPDASQRTCAALPDLPLLDLGPFSFGSLQILPTRDAYLNFLDDYSDAQAGEATSLVYLTPEFATTAQHTDLGQYGVVSYLNGEIIDTLPEHAFSFCTQEESQAFVVRTARMQNPLFKLWLQQQCAQGSVPQSICSVPFQEMLDLSAIADWQNLAGETTYEIGVFWDFPFLIRMEYEAVLAGSVTGFGLSVPFGFASPAESFYGTPMWLEDEFYIEPALTQCERFCEHPTFHSGGVYHVTKP